MFKNRYDAGLQLAKILKDKLYVKDFVVVAIPRGGVIIGKIISDNLSLKLFALVIKKIGSPYNPELAIGAAGSNGTVCLDSKTIKELGFSKKTIEQLKSKKVKEAKVNETLYDLKLPVLAGKNIILADDGVATGLTVETAVKILRNLGSDQIILAVPVISEDTFNLIKRNFDEIIYLLKPSGFNAVGEFYKEFKQVTDMEVKQILALAASN